MAPVDGSASFVSMTTSEQLQIEKLTHEVDKLRIEVGNMRRPVRAYLNNPGSYLTLLTAAIGVAAFTGQSYVNEEKSERSKKELAVAELKTKALELDQKDLTRRKHELQQEHAGLSEQKKQLERDRDALSQDYAALVAKRDQTQAEFQQLTARLQQAQQQLASSGRASTSLDAAVAQAQKLEDRSKAAPLKARLYIQIGRGEDKPEAMKVAAVLKEEGILVPEIESVGSKADRLTQTELRYFWEEDAAEATALARQVEGASSYGRLAVKSCRPA